MAWYQQWRPYVPVAQRRRQAQQKMAALRKKGLNAEPVAIDGRKIAKTFWGEAWCEHLESFSDYENRLPRGRTYVRNGSVCHLAIARGKIEAKVAGQDIYNLTIRVETLPLSKWESVKKRCAGQIGSLIELLQGNLSDHVMAVVTDRKTGLFPLPDEIAFDCDCPDWAVMCKHVAAVLYGVGARLDTMPELLFLLRGVNHEDLIAADAEAAVSQATRSGKSRRLTASSLSDVFGIDLESAAPVAPESKPPRKTVRKRTGARKKTVKKVVRAIRKKGVRKPENGAGGGPAAEGPMQKKAVGKKVAKKQAAQGAAENGASGSAKRKAVRKKRTAKARRAVAE